MTLQPHRLSKRSGSFRCETAKGQVARSVLSVLEPLEGRRLLSGTFVITSYGASTGSTNNSAAIESAFTAANAAGGGTVEVPSGTFLSTPISTSFNNVTLNIASGGILRAQTKSSYGGDSTKFITFNNDSNVGITGPGEIDGNGSSWWSSSSRPALVYFNHSTTVTMGNVTLLNSPKENVTFTATNNVTCNGTIISAPSTSPNTDGIDPAGSNYTIENCTISDGDDDIAVKALSVFCNNILVTNCTIGYGHGVGIGAGSTDGVTNMTVNDITMKNTTFGIRLKANRGNGGTVQNCTYSNITMTNVGTPIEITSWYDSNPKDPETVSNGTLNATTPIWKNITFSNITATGATHAGDIYGLPEESVGAITLSDVKITSTKTGMFCYYCSSVIFTNGSSITASSGPICTIWDATVSGITTTEY
jgi:polygalacturonase